MNQIYDNENFFSHYAQMSRSREGLEEGGDDVKSSCPL